ncbi:MAG: hypothetical protein GKR88_12635 [Flavobacteriaceae bacterium]|nr:MAG: hypothetical protein GKR88_12635 [Flavobacteriaceae bacterium]
MEKDKQIALAVKNKEVAVQKEISKKQKEWVRLFAMILIIILLFLTVLFYLYRIKIKQHALINIQKEQLENLNTTKNYLLSVISHDLRIFLIAIKGNHKKLSALLNTNRIEDASILNTKSTSISESTSQIVNNILNWALQQNNQLLFIPDVHPIGALTDTILYDFKPLAFLKNITLSAIYKNPNIQVYLDKELFKIAFRNLIDNAIKYAPENGKITIEVASDDKKCTLKIKDTGVGISQKILNTIHNYNALVVKSTKGIL